jgi:hypothetical protein
MIAAVAGVSQEVETASGVLSAGVRDLRNLVTLDASDDALFATVAETRESGIGRRDSILVCAGAVPRRGATHPFLGPVAQLAEQQTLNLRVVGSIPTRLTIFSSALSDGAK